MWFVFLDFSSCHDIDIMDFTQNTAAMATRANQTKRLINGAKDLHVHYHLAGDCRLVTLYSLLFTLSLFFLWISDYLPLWLLIGQDQILSQVPIQRPRFAGTVPRWWMKRLERSSNRVILSKWLLVKAQLILPSLNTVCRKWRMVYLKLHVIKSFN